MSDCMMVLVFTLAGLTAFIVLMELICWKLFRRKMKPMRFPSEKDPSHSHFYYLDKARSFAFAHTLGVTAFVWIFCIFFWW
jgi:Trk-type K+ transport system membrane component